MSYETGAPPPPPPDVHKPVVFVEIENAPGVPAARPARGYDSVAVIMMGPPPGTVTYRLRGTETTGTTGSSGTTETTGTD